MAERILESGGHSVKIGGRALDILMALVDHAPKLVGKRELIARVWGQSVVEEGAVHFGVAALLETLDLQRVKAQILIERPPHEMREGEARLLSALDVTKQQGLPAMELRVGIHLAKLWRSRGLPRKAIDLLRSICDRFADGSETGDIRRAAHLLEELRSNLLS